MLLCLSSGTAATDAGTADSAPAAGDEASEPAATASTEGGDVDSDPLSTLASAAITAAKTETADEVKVSESITYRRSNQLILRQ